ncbi:MAG: hypothetical protein AAFQ51_17415, partial [Pseudomonadota bacterium]
TRPMRPDRQSPVPRWTGPERFRPSAGSGAFKPLPAFAAKALETLAPMKPRAVKARLVSGRADERDDQA